LRSPCNGSRRLFGKNQGKSVSGLERHPDAGKELHSKAFFSRIPFTFAALTFRPGILKNMMPGRNIYETNEKRKECIELIPVENYEKSK
jgi:hypothetical protein